MLSLNAGIQFTLRSEPRDAGRGQCRYLGRDDAGRAWRLEVVQRVYGLPARVLHP